MDNYVSQVITDTSSGRRNAYPDDTFETHTAFSLESSVHSAAMKFRLQEMYSSVEEYIKSTGSKWVATDQVMILKFAEVQLRILADNPFYVSVLLAIRETTGAAFPGSTEDDPSEVNSEEEILEGIFTVTDHDFLFLKRPRSAKRTADGKYLCELKIPLTGLFRSIQGEELDPSDDSEKGYSLYYWTFSPQAQTLNIQKDLKVVGKNEKFRTKLLKR